uniref:G-protein coupled receptors family 1 profile domain-containing protein n=1 Tax=Parascaris univalens TaxID=6257 RepID=A0A915BHJ5_PARUN
MIALASPLGRRNLTALARNNPEAPSSSNELIACQTCCLCSCFVISANYNFYGE